MSQLYFSVTYIPEGQTVTQAVYSHIDSVLTLDDDSVPWIVPAESGEPPVASPRPSPVMDELFERITTALTAFEPTCVAGERKVEGGHTRSLDLADDHGTVIHAYPGLVVLYPGLAAEDPQGLLWGYLKTLHGVADSVVQEEDDDPDYWIDMTMTDEEADECLSEYV